MRHVGPRALFVMIAAYAAAGTPCSAQTTIEEVIRFHLAFDSFSEVYSAVSSGVYDAFRPSDVAVSLFECDCGFSGLERDAILERLLERNSRDSNSPRGERPYDALLSILVQRFARLTDHAMRARVLRDAAAAGVENLEPAVLHSAASLASMLGQYDGAEVTAGYEVEAMAVAATALSFPSTALAELLRTIAEFSRDRRVVNAARNAARAILQAVGERDDEAI